jgi:putative acetyltransferase
MDLKNDVLIRSEEHGDSAAVHGVNEAAFDTAAEADLVDILREQARPVISLVAESGGAIVGHIMFSPVTLPGHPTLRLMGLGPMAVAPALQRRGIGSALVRAGLERCRQIGSGAVVVLGHPEYYPRFGFLSSTRFGIDCEFDVPSEVFMAMELEDGRLRGVSGRIEYHPAFRGL